MKQCTKCKEVKTPAEFYRHKNKKDGLCSQCKDCINTYVKGRYAKRNPVSRRACRLKYQYGLSLSQYKKMLTQQASVCAICGNPETVVLKGKLRPLSVDHCHKTGKVRGLLCNSCNVGLSRFKDNIDFLASAASYLTDASI